MLWMLQCCVDKHAPVLQRKMPESGFQREIEVGVWRGRNIWGIRNVRSVCLELDILG